MVNGFLRLTIHSFCLLEEVVIRRVEAGAKQFSVDIDRLHIID